MSTTTDAPAAPQSQANIGLLWGVLVAVTLAELVTSAVHPQFGMLLHAALLIGLTIYGAFGETTPTRRLSLALTLAPLIRLLSLSLPLIRFPQAAWYPIVAVPLLIAAFVVVKLLELKRGDLGLRLGNLPLQVMLIGGGLGLGAIEYSILQPKPMVEQYTWSTVIIPALSLVIFTGFTEEFIFRGLLQHVAAPVLGRWALIYVALLFGVLHIGYLSVTDVAFVFAVGLLFGEIVRRGGSILGVTLAHGLTNITLFLIMPYLSANPDSKAAASAPWAVWGLSAVALIAVNVIVLRGVVRRTSVLRPAEAPAPVVATAPAKPARAKAARSAPAAQPALPAGALIRAARRGQNLAYIDVAERTGIPVRILAEIEHGLRLPQPEQVRKILDVLGTRSNVAAGAFA